MQKWVLAILLLAAGVVRVGAQEADLATAPRISMQEFKSLVAADKVLVVDVRDPMSFTHGHIPGARSIPLGDLLDKGAVKELKRAKKPIVLYCA
jgi:rhodanese-related sulfurtransferase